MNLILCIHNHQPVGNMEFILEEAYKKAYWPFLKTIEKFPEIKINMHISGYLFLWLLKKKEEYIELLKTLVDKGQIEMISGGMYEPVLSLVPEADAVEQIKMHRAMMKKVFGVKPEGLWLAERVYEPHIPRILHKAGILYTLVDDHHFKVIGFREDELYAYFATEFDGNSIFLFPGLKFLRYAIPFKLVKDIDLYFRSVKDKGADLLTFGDDGEKFGLWPGTFKHVYEERWLESFFRYLEDQKEWIKTRTFAECIALKKPKDLVYLDCCSYSEMGEWAFPPYVTKDYNNVVEKLEEEKKFLVRGGYFKHFLIKYPEANDMHKRMIEVSSKIKSGKAKEHLFLAQCNDAYWHGIFGGLYLPHLRSKVYENLIIAESLSDLRKNPLDAFLEDINLDGTEEGVLNSKYFKAYFSPKEGGTLYELDFKPRSVNLMANLTRRYESYHEKLRSLKKDVADGKKTIHEITLAKEENLDSYLFYDWYRRASLIDHIMGEGLDFDIFYRGNYIEPGDFVKEPYEARIKKGVQKVKIEMERKGHFWKERNGMSLNISKTVEIKESQPTLFVDYLLKGEISDTFFLGIEFNFSFLSNKDERRMETEDGIFPLTLKGTLEPSSFLRLYDPYQDVKIELLFMEKPISIWTFPIEVVSISEEGFERNYECTMVMPIWKIEGLKEKRHLHFELTTTCISHHNHLQ